MASSEVDIGRCQVAQALVVALVIVVLDEAIDVGFKVTRQVVVFKQDAVLERLVPTLDLALGLGMAGRSADVVHAGLFGTEFDWGVPKMA